MPFTNNCEGGISFGTYNDVARDQTNTNTFWGHTNQASDSETEYLTPSSGVTTSQSSVHQNDIGQMGSPESSEALIAIMGPTGTGKSSFIKLITEDDDIDIGHSLESQTDEIKLSSYKCGDCSVTFVDTPGFDDSREDLTDADILGKIAAFLGNDFKNGKRLLNGVIYMHRISDTKMGGMSRRNLRMFQKLVGSDLLQNVIIVTTMWDLIPEEVGRKREEELRTKFFKPLLDAGAKLIRHNEGFASGCTIMMDLLQNVPKSALIADEVAEGRTFAETSAGAVLNADIAELVAKHKREMQEMRNEIMAAVKAKDMAMAKDVEEIRKESQTKVKLLEEELQKLQKHLEISGGKEKDDNEQKDNEQSPPSYSPPLARDQTQVTQLLKDTPTSIDYEELLRDTLIGGYNAKSWRLVGFTWWEVLRGTKEEFVVAQFASPNSVQGTLFVEARRIAKGERNAVKYCGKNTPPAIRSQELLSYTVSHPEGPGSRNRCSLQLLVRLLKIVCAEDKESFAANSWWFAQCVIKNIARRIGDARLTITLHQAIPEHAAVAQGPINLSGLFIYCDGRRKMHATVVTRNSSVRVARTAVEIGTLGLGLLVTRPAGSLLSTSISFSLKAAAGQVQRQFEDVTDDDLV